MRLRILQILTLSLPLVCRPGSGDFDGPKQMIMACGAAALLGGRACASWRGAGWSPPSGALSMSAASVLLAGIVSLSGAEHAAAVWRNLWPMAIWMYVLLEIEAACIEAEVRRGLLTTLLAGGVLTSLIGLAQVIGLAPGGDPSTGLPIAVSTLGNRNEVAGLAAILAVPAVGMLLSTSRRGRIAAGLTATVFVITVVVLEAAGPRLALAAAGLSLGFAVWLRRRGRDPLWAYPAAAIAALVIWGSATLVLHGQLLDGQSATQSADQIQPNPHSIRERLLDWRIAVESATDNPVTGTGLGHYGTEWFLARERLSRSAEGSAYDFHAPRATRAHNDLLQWWSETGAAGVLMAVGALVILTGALIRRRRRVEADARVETLYLLSGLVAAFLHALVSFPLHRPASALVVVVLVGLMIGPGRAKGAPAHDHGLQKGPRRLGWLGSVPLVVVAVAIAWFAVTLQRSVWLADAARVDIERGNTDTAVETLATARKLTPWPGEIVFLQGLAALQAGGPTQGGAFLEESLTHTPTYRALLLLAEAWADQGRNDDALSLLERIEHLHPDEHTLHDALFLRGKIARARGDDAYALACWQRIPQRADNYHRALVGMGAVAASGGDPAAAQRRYRQALTAIDRKIDTARTAGASWRVARLEGDRGLVVRALRGVE